MTNIFYEQESQQSYPNKLQLSCIGHNYKEMHVDNDPQNHIIPITSLFLHRVAELKTIHKFVSSFNSFLYSLL